MSTNRNQVVVAYDFTNSARAALLRALTLAPSAHVLHFVCVIEPRGNIAAVPRQGPADYQYAEHVQQALTDEIARELRLAEVTDQIDFFVHTRIGKPADEILMLAREIGADEIIVGTKGLTGVERFLLGSVAEKVVREAGCPVEVAREKAYAHVDLLDVVEVEPDHHRFVPPHRYYYEGKQLQLRPAEWPLW